MTKNKRKHRVVGNLGRWQEPRDIAEAGARRDKTTEALFTVEAALANVDGDGSRAVRVPLIMRKQALVLEIRRLKAWFRQHDRGLPENGPSNTKLLHKAYELILLLKNQGVDLDPPEEELLKQIEANLKTRPPKE